MKLCFSASKEPGDFGKRFHNGGMRYLNLDMVYVPLAIPHVIAFDDMLRFARGSGQVCGISVGAPWKKHALHIADVVDNSAELCENANTLVIDELGVVTAHNTDYYAMVSILREYKEGFERFAICGSGPYAHTAAKALAWHGYHAYHMSRKDNNWNEAMPKKCPERLFINCTPVVLTNRKNVINANPKTKTGIRLAKLQGSKQFALYTGRDYPDTLMENDEWKNFWP